MSDIMATTRNEGEQRVAIWTVSPQMLGAYFVIFLIQYIPAITIEAYGYIQQRTEDDTFATVAIEIIVNAAGPIGIGSAMNAIAVALFMEAVMVLARMLSRQQREQGHAEGVAEERKRANAKLRALAKKYDIPEEELRIEDEDDR